MTETLRSGPLRPPDRDWETLRAAAMTRLAGDAPDWTDHNLSDPGVTIAEAIAWALADLHYRTEHAPLAGWSATAGLWRAQPERHWSGAALPADHARLRVLADALATLPDEMLAAVRRAVTRVAGLTALAGAVDPDLAPAAARLLRAPLVLRAALDAGAAVAAALTLPDDDAALTALRIEPAFDRLWDEEVLAVLARARRRAFATDVRRRAAEIRRTVGSAASAGAAETALAAGLGLTPAQARDVLGVHPAPPGAQPELWEDAGGRTTAWPPHPLQARTVEPVTLDDYARLARGVPGVRRAWAVAEVLPGIGWDGAPVAARAVRAGAVTLLVEPTAEALPTRDTAPVRAFLREVLRNAVGSEVDTPFANLAADLRPAEPRRVICDEVGAALLGVCPIELRGVLHVAPTADRNRVLAAALARVAALFAGGRAESAATVVEPEFPRDVDGPWPLPPPRRGGWNPGEPIRLAEVVQELSRDPDVLGVEALVARVAGTTTWAETVLAIDPACVPALDVDDQCVSVKLDVTEGCGDGC